VDHEIARFNERITFQQNTVTVDQYQNHTTVWTDYFSCYTYASTYQQDREKGNPVIREDQTITFEVRYCSELKVLDSIHFRVIFHGDIYNILNVDMMNYQRKTIKVRCKLATARPVSAQNSDTAVAGEGAGL